MNCFKSRVEQFYTLFAQKENVLRDNMDKGDMETAAAQMHELLEPVLGDLMFQLYKKSERTYILECNTMLDSSKKILCFYFCDSMPKDLKKYWTFYYYHPAFRGNLTLGDRAFFPQDFHMVPNVQDKAHKIDLQVSTTEKFAGIGDKDRYAITYMMLMDYLGEIAAEAYVGRISFRKKSLTSKGSSLLSMEELQTFLNHTIQSKGWVKPGEIRLIADSFQLKNRGTAFRKDLVHGLSYSLDLLNEEEEPAEKRFRTKYILDCGVRYGSLVLPVGQRTEAEMKQEQEAWEKKLSGIFSDNHSGAIVTSSAGNAHSYLDFFAYDEKTYMLICEEGKRETPPLPVLDLETLDFTSVHF